jgi:hypothetical protein
MKSTDLLALGNLLVSTRAMLQWELELVANPHATACVEINIARPGQIPPRLFLPAKDLEEFIGLRIQENLTKLSEAGIDMSADLESFKSIAETSLQQNNSPVDTGQ